MYVNDGMPVLAMFGVLMSVLFPPLAALVLVIMFVCVCVAAVKCIRYAIETKRILKQMDNEVELC